MDVACYQQSYNSYGGSSLFGPVGDVLSLKLGEYGPGVQKIEITAFLRSPGPPRKTLEDLYRQFHAGLPRLPRVVFYRQRKTITIHYLSQFTDEDTRAVSAKQKRVAAREIAVALQLIRTKVKSSDDFDAERFLKDAEALLSQTRSAEEWKQIAEAAREKWAATQAAKDPWDRLEIDWKKYHPKARDVLDDPFYWSSVDDMAPNGNDTGADLLEDFRRWNKRNPRGAPLKFLDRLMQGWGIKPIDWLATSPAVVRELDKSKPIPLHVCNEVAIGLAFAVIKLRGTCPAALAQYAQAALKRTALLVKDSSLDASIKSQWDTAIARMQEALNGL